MVRLVPMTQAEFERYLEHAIEDYARAHVKAGDGDLAEMLVASKADYDSLLPEGLASKNQHLFSLRAVDARLREMGIGRMALNVMGWNTRARELYEREGYTVAGIGMHKVLA